MPPTLSRLLSALSAQPQRLQAHWCVSPETGQWLAWLTRLIGARRVLEVGTSIGYSGLWFLQALCETDGHLTSIDASMERQAMAAEHFARAGQTHRVTLLCDDAQVALARLGQAAAQTFDLVFLDARKDQYLSYLDVGVTPLLRPGGLLIADNTESHRQQMAPFLSALQQRPQWQVVSLPVGSGLLLGHFLPQCQ